MALLGLGFCGKKFGLFFVKDSKIEKIDIIEKW